MSATPVQTASERSPEDFRPRCLDLTLPTAEENLACDEALLDAAEVARGGAVLRFWEAHEPFVVLGYANKVGQEVNAEACRAGGVPILRRCSGGGTVFQAAGCLNYSLVLPIEEGGETGTITGTNRFIMERNATALATMLGTPVTVEGHTDLALLGRKFSGNAQRRKRGWLLFHGTFLLDFDIALVGRYLLSPPRQPPYREGRPHAEFLTRLSVPPATVKAALRGAWQASGQRVEIPLEAIQNLVAKKYSRPEWNLRW